MVPFRAMKTAVATPNPTATAAARKKRFPVRDRDGHGKAGAAPTMRYDAEDIEEANRIGAAVCRQHAR